jgi:hypothetical protein
VLGVVLAGETGIRGPAPGLAVAVLAARNEAAAKRRLTFARILHGKQVRLVEASFVPHREVVRAADGS